MNSHSLSQEFPQVPPKKRSQGVSSSPLICPTAGTLPVVCTRRPRCAYDLKSPVCVALFSTFCSTRSYQFRTESRVRTLLSVHSYVQSQWPYSIGIWSIACRDLGSLDRSCEVMVAADLRRTLRVDLGRERPFQLILLQQLRTY